MLQQTDKCIYTEIRLTDNGTQCTSIQFPVIRHNNLSKGIIATQDNVTSMLSPDRKTCFF